MPRKSTKMTDAHKAALAAGREQSRAVRDYLEAIEAAKPRRGRKRTPASIKKRLTTIEGSLPDASALQRLLLTQERTDLEYELENLSEAVDLSSYEKGFVKHGKAYAEAKGINYATFRSVGVSADVLQRAGITRSM
ncbi:MAG TPA: hypothetical protein VGO03_05865 [Acidimicrobiia bacterium]